MTQKLHALLNRVAKHSYELGYKDAKLGRESEPKKVEVALKHIRMIR